MELLSTGNPDINNPVTMSMLEYLSRKGRETMKMTNGERIRVMNDEDLVKFLSEFSACKVCEHYNKEADRCYADSGFVCVKEYAQAIIGDWLKQPVEDRDGKRNSIRFNQTLR